MRARQPDDVLGTTAPKTPGSGEAATVPSKFKKANMSLSVDRRVADAPQLRPHGHMMIGTRS